MFKMGAARFWFMVLLALGAIGSQIGGAEIWGTAPPEAEGAATNLRAEVTCSGGRPVATLTWTNVLESPQQVEVATFVSGFEQGAFEAMGPLPPRQTSVLWKKVNPGVLHYWRVLTFLGGKWVASPKASFNGKVCIADLVPQP